MNLPGNFQLQFSNDGVVGFFLKNGVREPTFGDAREAPLFSLLGRVDARRNLVKSATHPSCLKWSG